MESKEEKQTSSIRDKKGTESIKGDTRCSSFDNEHNVGMVVLAKANQSLANPKALETWIVDCACSKHVCSQIEIFTSMLQEAGNIQVGNKAFVRVKGVENFALKTFDDGKIFNVTLSNVLLALEMLHNLLPSSQV